MRWEHPDPVNLSIVLLISPDGSSGRRKFEKAADGEAGTRFDRLMALNGEVFAAGHYEAAYHTLMAASHLAESMGDWTRLVEIARVAGQQQEHIDSLNPAHRLSSQMAKSRGHESIFAFAVQQASVRARIAHLPQRQDEAPRPASG
jgi:hypothetical protein